MRSKKRIIPRLIEGRGQDRPIRIWVPGCATGEEAYSLAMQFAEQTMGAFGGPPVQLFATDIDEQAIAAAREGLYTLNDAADVSPERLRRFFVREGENFRIRREVREMVLIRPSQCDQRPAVLARRYSELPEPADLFEPRCGGACVRDLSLCT